MPDGSGRTLDPRTGAVLAYVALWVGGLAVVWLERENRYVRFHAVQSIVALGGLWLLGLGCWATGFVMLAVSDTAFQLFIWLGNLAWGAMVIAWAICLYKAARGERGALPIAGRVAERWVQ